MSLAYRDVRVIDEEQIIPGFRRDGTNTPSFSTRSTTLPTVRGNTTDDHNARGTQGDVKGFRHALEQCRDVLTRLARTKSRTLRTVEGAEWATARLIDFDLWIAATGAVATDENGLCHLLRLHLDTLGVFTTLFRSLNQALRRLDLILNPTSRVTATPDENAVEGIESSSESSDDDDDDDDDVIAYRLLSIQREIDTLMHCLVNFGASVRSASLSLRMFKADTNFDRRHHKELTELEEHLRLVVASYSAYTYGDEDPRETSTEAAIQDVLGYELEPAQAHIIETTLRRRHRYIWAGSRADSFKASNAREVRTASTRTQDTPTASVPVADRRGLEVSSQHDVNPTRNKQTPVSMVSTIQTSQLLAIPVPVTHSRSAAGTPSRARSGKNTAITAKTTYPKPPGMTRERASRTCICPCCRNILSVDITGNKSSWKQVYDAPRRSFLIADYKSAMQAPPYG